MGKLVLVMRQVTERPEGLWANTVKLVGTDREKLSAAIRELLDNPDSYQAMAQAKNPYGDGQAALAGLSRFWQKYWSKPKFWKWSPLTEDPRSIIIGIPGQDSGVAAMFLFDRLDFKGQ